MLNKGNAYIGKGNALIGLKRYEESLEAFEEAQKEFEKAIDNENLILSFIASNIVFNDNLVKWKYNTIYLYALIGKGNTCIGKGNALISLNRYEEALEKFEEALEVFEKAITIDPKNVDALIGKGNIFSNLEMHESALRIYQEVIEKEPKNASAWKNKGLIFLKLKRYVECRETLEKALSLSSENLQILNSLAEYHLIFGDFIKASEYIETALSISSKNALSLGLKGKIKIEEQKYSASLEFFEKAISLDLRNPRYLIWCSYAKYLMAELELSSDGKKYQDSMLAIIRELEKVDKYCFYDNKKSFEIIPCWFNCVITIVLKYIQKTLFNLNISKNLKMSLLKPINSFLNRLARLKIKAYNYYFLGCFYTKIEDYSTAIYYFKKCKYLKSNCTIYKSAHEILGKLWDNNMRPSTWNWWLYSPLNTWLRRLFFLILILSLSGILLPSLFLHNSFFLIDWQKNEKSLTLLTLIIIFIILSPNVQRFKANEIEIEIHTPIDFELVPSMVERQLNDIIFQYILFE